MQCRLPAPIFKLFDHLQETYAYAATIYMQHWYTAFSLNFYLIFVDASKNISRKLTAKTSFHWEQQVGWILLSMNWLFFNNFCWCKQKKMVKSKPKSNFYKKALAKLYLWWVQIIWLVPVIRQPQDAHKKFKSLLFLPYCQNYGVNRKRKMYQTSAIVQLNTLF